MIKSGDILQMRAHDNHHDIVIKKSKIYGLFAKRFAKLTDGKYVMKDHFTHEIHY